MAKSQALKNPNNSVQMLIAGIFVLVIYVPEFIWMWDRWFTRDSYYSHGILVPFVTAYLIWLKKDILKKIPLQSSPWGMKIFFLGIAIHLVSAVLRVYFTSGFSLIIVLFGLVLHFYGAQILKEIIFPLSFLLFMVPLPMVVIANISFKLKLMAAQLSALLLKQMGFPCVQQGSAIVMRHAYVIVDDVCSGLRSLISLMALGSLFAHWLKASPLKKMIVFLSSIPIAVAANIGRIVFLAVVSEIWGTQYVTHGILHPFSGFIVFGLAFLLLYTVGKSME